MTNIKILSIAIYLHKKDIKLTALDSTVLICYDSILMSQQYITNFITNISNFPIISSDTQNDVI